MAHPALSECDLRIIHLAVVRALEYVGLRIVMTNSRSIRTSIRDVPLHLRYTVVPVDEACIERVAVSRGMWSSLCAAYPELAYTVPLLDAYVRDLIQARLPHDAEYLLHLLAEPAGVPADV